MLLDLQFVVLFTILDEIALTHGDWKVLRKHKLNWFWCANLYLKP